MPFFVQEEQVSKKFIPIAVDIIVLVLIIVVYSEWIKMVPLIVPEVNMQEALKIMELLLIQIVLPLKQSFL